MKKSKIKVTTTLETQQKLTKKEVAAIKKAISGQVIKTVSSEGKQIRSNMIIEVLTHADVVHTPQTMA